MAVVVREALNAAGMQLPIFCGNTTFVGVSLTGTWVGTVKFFASTDGVRFEPVQLTPFPSGTTVNSVTANGNWFIRTLNYVALSMRLTSFTSGAVVAALSASVDSSYQDAYLASTSKFVNSTASGATNTITVAAQANRAWRLRSLWMTLDSDATWAASPALTIKDGASTILWAGDVPVTKGSFEVPLPKGPTPGQFQEGGGVVNTVGSTMVIALASGGGAVKSNLNAEMCAA